MKAKQKVNKEIKKSEKQGRIHQMQMLKNIISLLHLVRLWHQLTIASNVNVRSKWIRDIASYMIHSVHKVKAWCLGETTIPGTKA